MTLAETPFNVPEISNNKFIFHTDYFQRPWTWFRRGALAIVLSLGVIILKVDDSMLIVKAVLLSIMVSYFILKQKDDVAISAEYLYHFKRSVLPAFARIDKYKLEDIISIRCAGIHNDGWELVDFFNGGGNMGGFANKMEMTFKDGSSTSLDLRVGKDNLLKLVSLANRLKQKTTSTRT